MKANEFVKKFGWGKSIELIEFYNRCGSLTCDCDFTYDELKRLVDSHELVEKDFKSVEMAEYEYMVSGDYSDIYWVRVKQAIADVELCQ